MAKNGNGKALGGFPLRIVTRSGRIEDMMRPIQNALYQQMQIVFRAPVMSYAIADASKTLNEYAKEDAVKASIEVGSLTDKPLVNIDDLLYVKDNIGSISQDEINERTKKIFSAHGDIDATFIFENMDAQKKSSYKVSLRELLPSSPESIRNFFTGVNVHDDGIKTIDEWIETYERFNDIQRRGELDRQYIQIFDKNSKKKPVLIFRGDSIEPSVAGILGENLSSGHLQSLDDYVNETWKEAVEYSKKELPTESKEIISDVIGEVNNNVYNIRHDDIRYLALRAVQAV